MAERDPEERVADPPETGASGPAADPPEERAPTPFDHPLFLPVLLIGFTLWFGYDGWLNADFDPQWIPFNRYGFFVLLALAAYFTIQAVRELRGRR
jgi:hypothetical protein